MVAEKINKIKSFFQLKIQINYLYFGSVFLFISLIHCYHILLIDLDKQQLEKIFLFQSFIQSFLEVSGLVLLYSFLSWKMKHVRLIFVMLITLLLLIHGIDFLLVRIMGLSFWEGLDLIINESFENFVEILYATHVSLLTWIACGCILLGLIFLGYFYYLITEKLCIQKPAYLSVKYFLLCFCFFPLLTLSFEKFYQNKKTSFEIYREYQKALPWKNTLYSLKKEKIYLKNPLQKNMEEKKFQAQLQGLTPLTNKPDLFLFVVESLRSDFVNAEVTPHFHQLKQSGLSTKVTLSSANGTQLSWFSLFYSKFPFYFSHFTPNCWKSGSPPLQILKKLGYDIHVFSSVRLAFYQMDKRIFGVENSLANSFHLHPHNDSTEAYVCDQKTMQKLEEYIQKDPQRGGRCFIIFLESSHFDYSWPLESDTVFHPFVKTVNYMDVAFFKKNLKGIINRYRNAIHYLDRLFGSFVQTLKKTNNWEASTIVVTGDHGEEFYEHGHLFHASSLSAEQIHVPIIFKFPSSFSNKVKPHDLSSHIDIFPTLLHYLADNHTICSTFLDGESIFQEDKKSYAIVARYNASRNPYEFMIHDGEYKLLIQFNNKKEIFLSNALYLLDVFTEKNETFSSSNLHQNFMPILETFSLGNRSFSTSLSPQ